jgi:hypothetical protein
MRFATNSIRMLRATSGVVLLWMLSAVVADAAPATRRASDASVCSAQTVTVKKFRRQMKSFGGPLKRFMKRRAAAAAGLIDTTPRLARERHVDRDDDDSAIQNDAPVDGIDEDTRPIPSLRPVGVLHGSRDQRPRSRPFAPRSPRGPPPYA